MGVRYPTAVSTTLVTANIVTSAETVVVTSPPLTLTLDFSQVLLWYAVYLGANGAGSVNIIATIRRGAAVGGTQVSVQQRSVASPGNVTFISGVYVDTPGAVAGQQYSITITMQAATTNTSVTDVCLLAAAL